LGSLDDFLLGEEIDATDLVLVAKNPPS
jgi:hypothetical protein